MTNSRCNFSAGTLALALMLAVMPVYAAPALAGEKEAVADESALGKETLKKSEAFIENLGDKALASLVGDDLTAEERAKRFKNLLNANFDVPTIGRFALGRYWRNATPAQQQEYMKLFEKMIVDVYSRRFEEYSGQTLDVKGHVPLGKNDIMVKTELVPPEGEKAPADPVTLDWRVRYKDGQYKIIDVVVAGVSMSVTQRSDFAAVIEKGGGKVDALLTSLKDRKSGKKEPQKADKKAGGGKDSKES